jgi:hypothetical protein
MTLKPMLENKDLGNICHEHLEYYTYKSLKYLFETNGLEIFKIEKNKINGGSYKIFARHFRNGSINFKESITRNDVLKFLTQINHTRKKILTLIMKILIILNFILFVYGFKNNNLKSIKISISTVKKDMDMEVFKEKSYHQKEIMNSLKSPIHKIILINGVSGTGKTYMSISYALRSLLDNVYTSIVITKPMIGVDNEEIGFLPGDLNAKFNNWMAPVINTLYKIMDKTKIIKQIQDKKIMFYPIAFLRGETFDNQLIICDESQNLTPIQMKMLLTRIGKNSKLIFCGDLSQKDFNETSGFDDFIRRYYSFCNEEKEISFSSLSKTGGIINAYNAIRLANDFHRTSSQKTISKK